MTRLSVNINKIATIRNARDGNIPDVVFAAIQCEKFGAQGITVHPRPDERHIRYKDVYDLKPVLTTEFNIEGNPIEKFVSLVLEIKPDQVTLVPDALDAITSNHGWDTVSNRTFLTDIVAEMHGAGIRTSIFVDPDLRMIEGAALTGTDRVELYTEPYASLYPQDPARAAAPFVESAGLARSLGMDVNAGHDLNLQNLNFLIQSIPFLAEVSIGHALISDALYLGLEKTIEQYLKAIC
jgi:pyridoxine 5-phosphate synthase